MVLVFYNGIGNNKSNEICNSIGIGNSNGNSIGNNNNEICNSIGIGNCNGYCNSNDKGIVIYYG